MIQGRCNKETMLDASSIPMINGSEQHTEKKLEKEVNVGRCVEEIVGSRVKLWISKKQHGTLTSHVRAEECHRTLPNNPNDEVRSISCTC